MNVLLAQSLQERGLVAAPEQILKQPLRSVSLPDVIVDFQGLRLAIECEFGRNPGAKRSAYLAARNRVEQALAHIGVAVIYPSKLRSVPFDRAKAELSSVVLQYAIVTETALTHAGTQLILFEGEEEHLSFSTGAVDDLADSLRRSYEQLVKDETLNRAVELLESSIHGCLAALRVQPATTTRLAGALGIPSDNGTSFKARERNAVNRIALLILVNAMIFQEVLSQKEARVNPLRQFRDKGDLMSAISDHWRFILDKINYYPIFHTAHDLIQCFAADHSTDTAIRGLVETALRIVSWRAALRHDLAGRIYHRLLQEAKYLGAYYTSIPSATLLLKLAMAPENFSHDWSDVETLRDVSIADLACGTGTLLMAAADVAVDNHVRASVDSGKSPNLDGLHHTVVENMIYGYDVLPSAVHLTASTLALRVPDSPINVTHLHRMPLGGEHSALGTLEFLERESSLGMIFSQPEQITGKKTVSGLIDIPQLDLCTMNPPFTSSRHGNLLFGNLPDEDRKHMQRRLRRIISSHDIPASVTAGLAAVFVALADKYLKEGGRLALVLPRSVISGVAWKPTRDLFASKYRLDYLIASHEPGHWNFSENTSLSEVLIVATRLKEGEAKAANVICVNLWQQARNAIEALGIAGALLNEKPVLGNTLAGKGYVSFPIRTGERKFGEAIVIPWTELQTDLWTFPVAFAQSELVKALYHLRASELYLPTQGIVGKIPLCELGTIADLGPDPRDVYDGFDLADGKTSYPALWGHDAQSILTMDQSPNQYLQPLAKAKAGRPFRKLEHLWPKAGRVLVAQRTRLNTKRVTAVRVSKKVLGDVWCPVLVKKRGPDLDDAEKALVLWLNSTLGVLIFDGYREETEGAYVQYKKPVLNQMPVIDVWKISRETLTALGKAYDNLANLTLLPFSQTIGDSGRTAIDQALAQALKLPDISPLRELLGQEPIVSGSLETLF
jgi:hypothetical protein